MNLRGFAMGLISDHWIKALALGVLIAFAAWVWRIDSLRESYKDRWQASEQEYSAFRKDITDRATAALAKEKDQARAADKEHADALADARDATDRFIDAHRVRPESRLCPDPATTPTSPGLPQEVPTGIVVDQADVRACGDLYSYALSAHRWAVGLDQP